MEELQRNPNRTFIYVEIAFFARWWNEQTDETKEIVSIVLKNEQLNFCLMKVKNSSKGFHLLGFFSVLNCPLHTS